MDSEKEKLVLDGNAFYEIDLECLKKKQERENVKRNNSGKDTGRKGQRN